MLFYNIYHNLKIMVNHTRSISWKYAGLWKQGGLANVGCHVKYLIGSFDDTSTLNKLTIYFFCTFPLPITSSPSCSSASQPLEVLVA